MEAICAGRPDKESLFTSVLEQRTLVGPDGLASFSESDWDQIRKLVPPKFRDSRCTVLAHRSLSLAINESGWQNEELKTTGFIFASTTSQIDLWEDRLPHFQTGTQGDANIRLGIENQSLGTPALRLTEEFGVGGPCTLIASSCSASLQSLALALFWIRTGKVRRCIVGATEIHSTLTRVGFGSLRLLSKEVCRPFDKNRSGINLGEGAAFLCLEAADLRKDSGWGLLTGAGLSTDAHHPTSPHPDGLGSQISIQMALANAGMTAADVDWIYAHGTGSPANDLAEARAIHKIFASEPDVTSTKSIHGHTLAASGAIESVLGLLAMKRNLVLPTAQFLEADPQIQVRIPLRAKEQKIKNFVKNSLGFGGINASLIFSSGRTTA